MGNIKNRAVSVGGILQTAFRFFGKFRKVIKTVTTNRCLSSNLTRTQASTIFPGFPITVYIRFTSDIDIVAGAYYYFFSLGVVGSASNKLGFALRGDPAGTKILGAVWSTDNGGSHDYGLTANANAVTLVKGTTYDIVWRIPDNNPANAIFYRNGTALGATTTTAGTLLTPSSFADLTFNLSLGSQVPGGAIAAVGTFHELAIYNQSYTGDEAKANVASALVRYKFNDGLGIKLTNSGSLGSIADLNLTGITESTFHTLIQE
jgi:hypothetical protein